MKSISLTQGFVALVDDEDFDWLNQFKWCVIKNGHGKIYAVSRIKCKLKLMHHLILDVKPGELGDHIDGSGINNTRQNLRIATNSQNLANSKKHNSNTSGFKGVSYLRDKYRRKPWVAQIKINYHTKILGCFETPEEAAAAYDEAALKIFGEFARTNAQIEREKNL